MLEIIVTTDLKIENTMKLIDKDALVAEIEKYYNECLRRAKITDSDYWNAKADAYRNVLVILDDTLKVKEVDLNLIIGWFDHIAQIADDRLTLNGERMTDGQALIEIKCLAKDSSEFIKKWYPEGE